MTFEQVFMALTFISSGIALYFSARKQKHDNANIDADTIGKLYDLIDKQETRYQELKANLTAEIEELRAEVDILRGEKKVREDTIESMKRENSDLQAQVDKLQAAVKSRDKKISELGRQIVELTARLDAMNGGTL
jgi:chromosome segregation ATPase